MNDDEILVRGGILEDINNGATSPNIMWDDPAFSQGAWVTGLTQREQAVRNNISRLYPEELEIFTSKCLEKNENKDINIEEYFMPRKMTKAKEWSISSRALKHVIESAIHGRDRYVYKFESIYDNRFRIFRIWNKATQNVVCTVKIIGDKIFIRYRENSYYASTITGYNEWKKDKCIVIPSTNLAINRGRAESSTRHASTSIEAQIGFRRAMYEQKQSNKYKEKI